MATQTQTFSAKEVAKDFGTDARTFRKFLREHLPSEDQPGQGGRYTFTKGDIGKLKKAYTAWADGTAAKKKAAAESAVDGKATPKVKAVKEPKRPKAMQEPEEIEVDEDFEAELEEIEDLDIEDLEEDEEEEDE